MILGLDDAEILELLAGTHEVEGRLGVRITGAYSLLRDAEMPWGQGNAALVRRRIRCVCIPPPYHGVPWPHPESQVLPPDDDVRDVRVVRFDFVPDDADLAQLALRANDCVTIFKISKSGWPAGVRLSQYTQEEVGAEGWFPSDFLFPAGHPQPASSSGVQGRTPLLAAPTPPEATAPLTPIGAIHGSVWCGAKAAAGALAPASDLRDLLHQSPTGAQPTAKASPLGAALAPSGGRAMLAPPLGHRVCRLCHTQSYLGSGMCANTACRRNPAPMSGGPTQTSWMIPSLHQQRYGGRSWRQVCW